MNDDRYDVDLGLPGRPDMKAAPIEWVDGVDRPKCEWGMRLKTEADPEVCWSPADLYVTVWAPPSVVPVSMQLHLCGLHVLKAEEVATGAGGWIRRHEAFTSAMNAEPVLTTFERLGEAQRRSGPALMWMSDSFGAPYVALFPDGSIVYGDDYNPDEAAKGFWQTMMDRRPASLGPDAGKHVSPERKLHITTMLDATENPEGASVQDWLTMFPAPVLRHMLGVVTEATSLAEAHAQWLHAESPHEETETRLAAVEACEAVSKAVVGFWAEMGK